jgi:hypothetical protein
MAPDDLVFLEASCTTSVRLLTIVVTSNPAIVAVRCDVSGKVVSVQRVARVPCDIRLQPIFLVLSCLHITRLEKPHIPWPNVEEELCIVAILVHVEWYTL